MSKIRVGKTADIPTRPKTHLARNDRRAGARRLRSEGFTLVELLVVVAIIGVIASIIVPNLLDAYQKAKQKRTMADIRVDGGAWFSWLTDSVSAAAAGRGSGPATGIFNWGQFEAKSYIELRDLLVPIYASAVVELDGWRQPLEFGSTADLSADLPVGIRSAGSDGSFTDQFPTGPFVATDYDQDIVWAGGTFVHFPSGI